MSVNPGPSKSLYLVKEPRQPEGREKPGQKHFSVGCFRLSTERTEHLCWLCSDKGILTLKLEFSLGGARESSNNRTAELTQLKIKKVSKVLTGGEMQEKCCTLQQKVLLCISVGAMTSFLFENPASLSFFFSCTALGMAEIVPGTDKSDAVCAEQKMPEPSEDSMCPSTDYLLESSREEEGCVY